ALQELVGGDRGAVRDRFDVRRRRIDLPQNLVHAGEEALGGVCRGGRRLGAGDLAGAAVDGNNVGEGAAGVDADTDLALALGILRVLGLLGAGEVTTRGRGGGRVHSSGAFCCDLRA